MNPGSLAPVAGGAALFFLGVNEARQLARDDADPRRSVRHTAPARIIAGSLWVARPSVMGSALGRNLSGSPDASWLVRMVAIREVVLGCAGLAVSSASADARRWLLALSLVDGGEAVVVLDATRRGELDPVPGVAFFAADAGSATAAIALLGQLRR
jgi:hypothetical protein